MYITTIAWHGPAEKLPKKSGDYLVIKAGSGNITTLHYSKKYKRFNCEDHFNEADAEKYEIKCKYWAELLELPDTESEGV